MTAKRTARVAGTCYLLVAVFGLFAQYVARGSVHVRGDAAATTANIVQDADLVRLGFVADLGMATSYLSPGLAFYSLFRAVNPSAAGALVVFVAVGAGVTIVNLLNHFAALLVATDPAYGGLSDASAQALGLLWLDLHQYGYTTGGILFGLWLLPLGYLAYTSGMFPRSLGVLLMVASIGYLANTFCGLPDARPGSDRDDDRDRAGRRRRVLDGGLPALEGGAAARRPRTRPSRPGSDR